MVITLLWNADDDLDLAFTCIDDNVKIDWSNAKGENICGAVYDVANSEEEYNSVRGDGSLG